jgi:hypothetical protein
VSPLAEIAEPAATAGPVAKKLRREIFFFAILKGPSLKTRWKLYIRSIPEAQEKRRLLTPGSSPEYA